jgi:hypothetical protein
MRLRCLKVKIDDLEVTEVHSLQVELSCSFKTAHLLTTLSTGILKSPKFIDTLTM